MERTDAYLVKTKIRELCSAIWMQNRKWQPNFLFHFTDITNAIKILENEALFSRKIALERDLMSCDNASEDVIHHTVEQYKNYVRLYFRPRTPTQYNNEGFRPLSNLGKLKAHCPMPIMFLFDAYEILKDNNTHFSNGNIASKYSAISNDTKFYLELSFQDIYNDQSLYGIEEGRKRQITYHKQAEVLISDHLDLSQLKFIYCRSRAEFETLKNMLSDFLWEKWSNKIAIDNKGLCFYQRWPFIREVEMSTEYFLVYFNLIAQGPYNIRIEKEDLDTEEIAILENQDFYIHSNLDPWKIKFKEATDSYTIKIFIDDHIAYCNTFGDDDKDILF